MPRSKMERVTAKKKEKLFGERQKSEDNGEIETFTRSRQTSFSILM